MSDLLLGALSLLLATNPPSTELSNYVGDRLPFLSVLTGAPSIDPNDPVEQEFRVLLRDDDEATRQIEELLGRGPQPDPTRAPTPAAEKEAVRRQLLELINGLRDKYETFLKGHPKHVRARLAYADHLDTHGEDHEVLEQLRLALEVDPKNPVVWNNYAGHFGHVGPITNAFHAYEQAIALRPYEPLYHYNYGTVVFLYRKDAQEYFGINETQVFERALAEYREVRRLAPRVFRYAFDYAQTFYGVKPEPAETPNGRAVAEEKLAQRALSAWRDAWDLADNHLDREGIRMHFARWQIKRKQWDEAREQLAKVVLPEHDELKARLEKSLKYRESGGVETVPDAVPSITAPKLELKLAP